MTRKEHRRLRHARIKEILYEVSGLEWRARGDFLTAACAGDRDLRDEVESLLSYHDSRLDGVEETEAIPPRPAPDEKVCLEEAAAVGDADLSAPADAASGKAARRTRRKSSR